MKRWLYWALMAVFCAVFIFSAVYLIDYFMESKRQEELYDDLANMVGQYTDPSDPTGGDDPTDPTDPSDPTDPTEEPTDPDFSGAPTDPDDADPNIPDATLPPMNNGGNSGSNVNTKGILKQYRAIYLLNQDLVGWINIPNTRINYPVVQSSINKPDYYLKRDFYRDYSSHGCIYVREQCNVFSPSDNVTIYGHSMADKTMFADLLKYEKKDFWKRTKTFTFDTIYEQHTYQVIAVFKTSGTAGVGYPFHVFVDAASEAQFNQFIADVHSMQLYSTGVTAKYGDKLLCLCTCEYSKDNYRLVVVAKRIK